jgi:hypothetical protein
VFHQPVKREVNVARTMIAACFVHVCESQERLLAVSQSRMLRRVSYFWDSNVLSTYNSFWYVLSAACLILASSIASLTHKWVFNGINVKPYNSPSIRWYWTYFLNSQECIFPLASLSCTSHERRYTNVCLGTSTAKFGESPQNQPCHELCPSPSLLYGRKCLFSGSCYSNVSYKIVYVSFRLWIAYILRICIYVR